MYIENCTCCVYIHIRGSNYIAKSGNFLRIYNHPNQGNNQGDLKAIYSPSYTLPKIGGYRILTVCFMLYHQWGCFFKSQWDWLTYISCVPGWFWNDNCMPHKIKYWAPKYIWSMTKG